MIGDKVCDSQEVLSNLPCTGGAIVTFSLSVDSTVALVSDSLLTALTSNTQFNTDEQHNVQLSFWDRETSRMDAAIDGEVDVDTRE